MASHLVVYDLWARWPVECGSGGHWYSGPDDRYVSWRNMGQLRPLDERLRQYLHVVSLQRSRNESLRPGGVDYDRQYIDPAAN